MKLRYNFIFIIFISSLLAYNANNIEKSFLSTYPDIASAEKYFKDFSKELGFDDYLLKFKNLDDKNQQDILNNINEAFSLEEKPVSNVINKLQNSLLLLSVPEKVFSTVLDLGKSAIDFFVSRGKLDDVNSKIINEIKIILDEDEDEKYINIIENNIGADLRNIIEKEMKNLNLEKYISDYLKIGEEKEKINESFKRKVDSLNFMLLGDTEKGKNAFIHEILDLPLDKSVEDDDDDFDEQDIIKFEKYSNDQKKLI